MGCQGSKAENDDPKASNAYPIVSSLRKELEELQAAHARALKQAQTSQVPQTAGWLHSVQAKAQKALAQCELQEKEIVELRAQLQRAPESSDPPPPDYRTGTNHTPMAACIVDPAEVSVCTAGIVERDAGCDQHVDGGAATGQHLWGSGDHTHTSCIVSVRAGAGATAAGRVRRNERTTAGRAGAVRRVSSKSLRATCELCYSAITFSADIALPPMSPVSKWRVRVPWGMSDVLR